MSVTAVTPPLQSGAYNENGFHVHRVPAALFPGNVIPRQWVGVLCIRRMKTEDNEVIRDGPQRFRCQTTPRPDRVAGERKSGKKLVDMGMAPGAVIWASA